MQYAQKISKFQEQQMARNIEKYLLKTHSLILDWEVK